MNAKMGLWRGGIIRIGRMTVIFSPNRFLPEIFFSELFLSELFLSEPTDSQWGNICRFSSPCQLCAALCL
jgi:hypothetical protein